jgi:DNA-binding transcriptional regulator YdaS (Cro superfamily)
MEKLVTFLKGRGMHRKDFAAHIGVAPSSLSEIMSGKHSATLLQAAKIERATGGAVQCIDLVDPTLLAEIARIE